MKFPNHGITTRESWGVADSAGNLVNAFPLPSRKAARETRAAMGHKGQACHVVQVLTITVIKDEK